MSNISSEPDSPDGYKCAGCVRPDTADDIVQCDKCTAWWHFSCAKVDASVANQTNWICVKCLSPPPPRSVSTRTTSSNRRALLEISLQRLAEEKELRKKELAISLEKEFLKTKYDLMEQCALDEEAETRSVRSHIAQIEARERERHVHDWVGEVAASLQVSKSLTDPKIPSAANAPQPNPANHSPEDEDGAVGTIKTNADPDRSPPIIISLDQTDVVTDSKSVEVSNLDINKDQVKRTVVVRRIQKVRDEKVPNKVPADYQLLKSQLLKCQEASKVDRQVLQDLQEELQKCKLQLHQRPLRPVAESLWPLRNVSKGAIPKTAPSIPTRPALVETPVHQSNAVQAKVAENSIPIYDTRECSWTDPFQVNGPRLREQPRNTFARSTDIGQISTPQQQQSNSQGPVADPFFPEERRPSPEQLSARQVMPRDLPEFYGNPEDWPIFISNFRNSTSACGFSRVENLARLQRCLKGNALKSVRYNLLNPDSVPEVIRTLQTLYGRPEIIISKLIRNVRDAPAPKSERLETLIDFGVAVRNLVSHLIAAEQRNHLSNPVLLQELVEKLPAGVKMQWAQQLIHFPDANLQTFSTFMSSVVESVSKIVLYRPEKPKTKEKGHIYSHVEAADVTRSTQRKNEISRTCPVCEKGSHRVKDCDSFKKCSVDSRWKTITALKLCRCCLSQHGRRACRSSSRCEIEGCQYRHHPLLHAPATARAGSISSSGATESHTYHHCNQSVLFRIIPVTVRGPSKSIDTFAFLDEGSSATLVEKGLAKQLDLKGPVIPLCLKWTADITRSEDSSRIVTLEISELGCRKKYSLNNARTVECLNLSSQTLCFEELQEKYQHLAGLPIRSYNNAKPQLLIGLRNLSLAVPQKIVEGSEGPIATKTRIGWCVYGRLAEDHDTKHFSYHICECDTKRLDNLIREYFDAEDTGLRAIKPIESVEIQRARRTLDETTRRNENHFATGLLWKFDHIELPDSFPMALQRLKCLERRMARDPDLKANLHKQLQEYQEKGYAHQATEVELDEADPRRVWYLPLGTVVNAKKPSKVRIIWDAAAKVDGVSLNTFLLPGPDLLVPLPSVLFRYRQYPVAVCGDIMEMFHQIRVAAEDRHAQRFLWRDSAAEPPKVFLMDVLTFGSASSPSSAQFVKNRNAKDHETQFPRAVEAILNRHYVDDYLDSFEDTAEAKRVAEQVRYIHSNGGFVIRNWSSNNLAVLKHLGEVPKATTKDLTTAGSSETERVLGMLWMTETDTLCFSTKFRTEIEELIHSKAVPTKRQILKTVMSLFDPLGVLAAFLVHGKIIMQDVWRGGVSGFECVDD
ncbi:uncharacterized protein LOC134203042 [Armigeres subalbatus]|uniref:uncharacterized protein LOC134203042 n=1 Tax=Armigeres subalbatus TaxID=124917 RepID=UPI002ED2851E